MGDLLVIWLVTSISLLIISQIDFFGIQVKSFGSALVVALVLGILNALLKPILSFISFPLIILTFGLFSVVVNAAIFWLASALVDGFKIKGGCLSALIGPIVLSLISSLLMTILR